jgi:ubiquinone/menaquinone biosynthesis C-methylase UbiE
MKRKNNIEQNTKDDYSLGYEKDVLDYLSYRALKSFDFVLPYLRPEMKVLECGCGSGIVTFELAKKITNGSVIGIDIDKDHVDSNNKKAKESNINNIKFELANVLELPYPDNSFDIVYMQALIVHIKTPYNAIREAHRVIKNNGHILLREPIMDRAVFSPENPLLMELLELYAKAIKSFGGDPSIGRKLWPILNETGFRDILISSSWEQPDSLDEWPDFYEGWVNVSHGKLGDIILKEGWADEKRLIEIRDGWMDLGKNRLGYAASAWGEAVAKK